MSVTIAYPSSFFTIAEVPGAITPAEDPILQYVVIRKDLKKLGWTEGAIIAQACHASTTAVYQFRENLFVKSYFSDIANLRKVTLSTEGESDLTSLATALTTAGVHHVLWIEQPENIPTSLATKPMPKSLIYPFVKHLRLLR